MNKVLLIGWDAADWKMIRPLIQAERMPNLRRMVEGGAAGDIKTLDPPLSPMLWTSICTGKRPFQHGIHGFTEPAPDGSGVRPVTNLSRKSKAVWNILNQNGLRSVVIGWWPSHPAEPIAGVMVSDHYHRARGPLAEGWPLWPHTIYPPELAETLAGLRVHPESLPVELVERFIPRAREIDQGRDTRLAGFLRTLAEAMSIQAAALWLMEHQAWDFFAVYYEAVDHFSHGFMRYHPPRQSWIAERDFELYRNVMAAAYEFHDEMLGALLERAGGARAILMSDHGFHPDQLRPSTIPDVPAGPAVEHRDFGILVVSGPGIRAGATIYGASVLDIAPTVLSMYGLAVGEDMDGKVLAQPFADAPAIETVASWEEVPGKDGRHPAHTRIDPVAAHEAMEQMIALGYVERPDENRQAAIRQTVRELRYNLAQSYQDAGRHQEAYPILHELWEADPGEQRFAVRLFASCQALGRREEMRRVVAGLGGRGSGPAADYLEARVLMAEKRYAEALALLQRLAEARLVRPGLFLETAALNLLLRRPGAARRVYEEALSIDADNLQAYIGLCRIALAQRDFTAAAHRAMDALERSSSDAAAHYLLGRALAGLRQYERAAEAFRAALCVQPNYPQAHLRLAALLEMQLGDAEAAREHRRLARQMREGAGARGAWETAAEIMDSGGNLVPREADGRPMPPPAECVVVVTGLPRSGTSLAMQMLAAGGMPVVADGLRQADEDNPRGYFEFEKVKNLEKDAAWLFDARGKAVKIVAPLLAALPPGLPCRVIFCERDVNEVLDSQERMLERRQEPMASAPERRRRLKEEYGRAVLRAKAMLAARPLTRVLAIDHRRAIADPSGTAEAIGGFLGSALEVGKMAAAVDAGLYRNRAGGPDAVTGSLRDPC